MAIAGARTAAQVTGRQPKSQATTANPRSVNPNAQTTVAPVGRSRAAEAAMPMTLTSAPKLHPMIKRLARVPPTAVPASAGTIR